VVLPPQVAARSAELVTIAIPGRLASEGMILIGLSLAMNLGVLALEDMFFVRRGL